MAHPPILTLDTGRLRTRLVPPCTHRASCAELIARLPTLIGRIVNLKCQHLAQFALMPPNAPWTPMLEALVEMVCQFMHIAWKATPTPVFWWFHLCNRHNIENHERYLTQELEWRFNWTVLLLLLNQSSTFFSNKTHHIILRANPPQSPPPIFFFFKFCWLQCWNAPLFFGCSWSCHLSIARWGKLCLVDMGHSVLHCWLDLVPMALVKKKTSVGAFESCWLSDWNDFFHFRWSHLADLQTFGIGA